MFTSLLSKSSLSWEFLEGRSLLFTWAQSLKCIYYMPINIHRMKEFTCPSLVASRSTSSLSSPFCLLWCIYFHPSSGPTSPSRPCRGLSVSPRWRWRRRDTLSMPLGGYWAEIIQPQRESLKAINLSLPDAAKYVALVHYVFQLQFTVNIMLY